MSVSVSVYKPTGRGRWMMAWRDDAGKLHRVSTGAKDKSVAKQIAREKERQLLLDPWGLVSKKVEPIRWTTLQEEFLEHIRAANRSQTGDAYKTSLGHFRRITGDTFIHQIDVAALQTFVQKRRKEKHAKKPISIATINKDLRAVRAALNWAVERSYIPVAPRFRAAMMREDRKAPVVVPRSHRKSVYAALDDPQLELKIRPAAWWRVLFKTIEELGVRRNEAMTMTWDNVDFAKREVTVEAGGSKGRRYRTLPLTDGLVAILREWKPADAAGADPVFPWELNTIRRFYIDWHAITAAAGLPKGAKLVPKNLRSTCGSELVQSGVPTVVVKDWLGHASVTTTEMYYANTQASMRPASDARAAADAREASDGAEKR